MWRSLHRASEHVGCRFGSSSVKISVFSCRDGPRGAAASGLRSSPQSRDSTGPGSVFGPAERRQILGPARSGVSVLDAAGFGSRAGRAAPDVRWICGGRDAAKISQAPPFLPPHRPITGQHGSWAALPLARGLVTLCAA